MDLVCIIQVARTGDDPVTSWLWMA